MANKKEKPIWFFPKRLAGKGGKANFRRTVKRFSIKNGHLCYRESRLVISDKEYQVDIIHDIHKMSGNTSHSKAMSAHLVGTAIYEKIDVQFFWYRIYNNVSNYIQKCDRCERQSSLLPKVKNEMYRVPVSSHVM